MITVTINSSSLSCRILLAITGSPLQVHVRNHKIVNLAKSVDIIIGFHDQSGSEMYIHSRAPFYNPGYSVIFARNARRLNAIWVNSMRSSTLCSPRRIRVGWNFITKHFRHNIHNENKCCGTQKQTLIPRYHFPLKFNCLSRQIKPRASWKFIKW
jgi:hypothetical protein